MTNDVQMRNRTIIRFAAIGVAINFALFVGKIIIGLSTGSKAIVLDSVNSISDSISCAFVIVSAALAMKNADRSHPFGYGRLEYVCSLLFSVFIMYLGTRAIVESVERILGEAQEPTYTGLSLAIMATSMISKIVFGILSRREGKRIRSTALIIAGTDSLGDSLIALSILAGMLIQKFFGLLIDDYLCILISLMIIRTGLDILRQCLNRILGMRVDPSFSKEIRKMIIMQDGVQNVSNLVIHDYGEGAYIGSVDINVDENLKASEISAISAVIKQKAKDMGLILTSVGVGAVNAQSKHIDRIQDKVLDVVSHHGNIVRIHSLFVDLKDGVISFYVVHGFNGKDHDGDIKRLKRELSKCFPDMNIEIFSSINAD